MTKDKKRMIFMIAVIAICSIAVVASVFAIITNAKIFKDDEVSFKQYNFDNIFNNEILSNTHKKEEIDEIVFLGYDLNESDAAKYDITIKLPKLRTEKENAQKINEDIFNIFIEEAFNIVDNSEKYTKYDIQYTGYINENLLSIVIRCNLKSGSTAQRKIIKTYVYDLKEDKILSLQDLIALKKVNKEKTQEKIKDEIRQLAENDQTITDIGYSVYLRNTESDIYKIENTTEFYINQSGEIFVVYPYGNTNYTTKTDVIKLN